MANEKRLYMVRMPDGTEVGPVDQPTLERWVESARLTEECQVRNTLVPRWNDATKITFLKKKLEERVAALDTGPTVGDKFRDTVTKSGILNPKLPNLSAVGTFVFTPASVSLRMLAGTIDLVVVLVYAGCVHALMAGVVHVLGPALAFYAGLGLFYLGAVMYVAWTVGFHAQTLGQRFWGLMVVRREGEQVFLGRAFVFAVGVVLLGWSSPFIAFVMPSKRALPDALSGTRVVRTKVVRAAG